MVWKYPRKNGKDRDVCPGSLEKLYGPQPHLFCHDFAPTKGLYFAFLATPPPTQDYVQYGREEVQILLGIWMHLPTDSKLLP